MGKIQLARSAKMEQFFYHVAMARGRSLGPQWLRGQGVTLVVSSDGLK